MRAFWHALLHPQMGVDLAGHCAICYTWRHCCFWGNKWLQYENAKNGVKHPEVKTNWGEGWHFVEASEKSVFLSRDRILHRTWPRMRDALVRNGAETWKLHSLQCLLGWITQWGGVKLRCWRTKRPGWTLLLALHGAAGPLAPLFVLWQQILCGISQRAGFRRSQQHWMHIEHWKPSTCVAYFSAAKRWGKVSGKTTFFNGCSVLPLLLFPLMCCPLIQRQQRLASPCNKICEDLAAISEISRPMKVVQMQTLCANSHR